MSIFSAIGDVLKGVTGAIGDVFNPIAGIADTAVSAFTGYQASQAQKQTNEQSIALARETNAFNAQQAYAQREWANSMSNTQWQRTVEDMQHAGLNPMLAYSQGPNTVPGGASASGVMPSIVNPTAVGVNAASRAAGVASTLADVRLKESQASVNEAQVPKIEAETMLTRSQREKVAAEVQVLDRAKFTEEWKAKLYQVKAELTEFDVNKMRPVELNELKYKVQLIEYALAGARNTSEGQKKWSWWMINVAPFIPDLLKSTGAARNAASAAGLRR